MNSRTEALLRLLACVLTITIAAPLVADDRPEPLAAPPLENAIRILDTEKMETVSLATLIDRLADAEVIFLGETHLDETTHRFQWRMYQELIIATEGRVVLSMEMFDRDAQPNLDDYLAGRIDESTFRKKTHAWGNYRTDYRPMVEIAKARSLPVVAANFPASVRRSLRMGGKEAYENLGDDDKRWIPKKLYQNSDAYWDRFARTIRGHASFFSFLDDPDARLHSAQSLWDNSMGEACVDALAANPGFKVLHLNGGFHTVYRQGTAAQVLHRRPETNVVVIDIRGASSLSSVGADSDWEALAEVADFVVYAEERARAAIDGLHAVTVTTELEFQLFLPKRADATTRVPLLIWMPRSGLRAADAMRYLRLAFGDTVAIAAVEPPFPQRGEDLYLGGEWYFQERFDSDLGMLGQGVVRLLSRLARTQPIDPNRVVLVGEGSAGTVVASTMLYSRHAMPVQAFAVRPKRYHKLRDGGMPKSRDPGPALHSFPYSDLVVFTDEADHGFWDDELADYAKTGIRVERRDASSTPLIQAEVAVRRALGIEPMPAAAGDVTPLVYRLDSPLSRFWSALEVRALRNQGIHAVPRSLSEAFSHGAGKTQWLAFAGELGELPLDHGIDVMAMKSSKILPRPPGPFGGTTIVVTYPKTPASARDAWARIEENDPIRFRSRFSKLRVAHLDEQPTIHEVLAEIRDGGGSNVLFVPAAFCATADEMRTLRDVVKGHLDGLEVHWLPGLGGRAYHRHAAKQSEPKQTEPKLGKPKQGEAKPSKPKQSDSDRLKESDGR